MSSLYSRVCTSLWFSPPPPPPPPRPLRRHGSLESLIAQGKTRYTTRSRRPNNRRHHRLKQLIWRPVEASFLLYPRRLAAMMLFGIHMKTATGGGFVCAVRCSGSENASSAFGTTTNVQKECLVPRSQYSRFLSLPSSCRICHLCECMPYRWYWSRPLSFSLFPFWRNSNYTFKVGGEGGRNWPRTAQLGPWRSTTYHTKRLPRVTPRGLLMAAWRSCRG